MDQVESKLLQTQSFNFLYNLGILTIFSSSGLIVKKSEKLNDGIR